MKKDPLRAGARGGDPSSYPFFFFTQAVFFVQCQGHRTGTRSAG